MILRTLAPRTMTLPQVYTMSRINQVWISEMQIGATFPGALQPRLTWYRGLSTPDQLSLPTKCTMDAVYSLDPTFLAVTTL